MERCTLNRAMRMTYGVNVVGKPKEGKKLSGMGATRRDPTWYGADYAPPLLHQRSSGLVVARQELAAIQGGQGTEPLQLGGGHREQVTPLVDMPPMEADIASQEDEGMASSSSDYEETSDDATDTQGDSDSSWVPSLSDPAARSRFHEAQISGGTEPREEEEVG